MKHLRRLLRYQESYVLLVIVLASVVITAVNPAYFTLRNLFQLLENYSFWGILAVGVLVVLVSGGIDISFTAVATVAEYIMAATMIAHGGNIVTAFLTAAAVGLVLGLINAVFIHFFRIPTIITTIATLNIYYGVLITITSGNILHSFPAWFNRFASLDLFTLSDARGTYGFSALVLIWLVVIVAAWLLLRRTKLGRGIYALGGSPEAARRVGFDILGMQMFIYGFMGLLGGIAGFVHGLEIGAAEPNSIVGHELDVIAMVVLGGASLFGGTGTLPGTLLGVALIAVLDNGLTLMRVSSYWHDLFVGLIILVSISFSAYRRRLGLRTVLLEQNRRGGGAAGEGKGESP